MPDAPDSSETDLLRRFLAGRDVECPACGYNLRGLANSRCPECNLDIALRVGLVEPRQGAYIAALAGHLAAAGAAVVCLVIVAAMTIRHGSPGARIHFAVYGLPWIMLMVQGGAAAALGRMRGRLWFRRLESGGRRVVVVSGWGLLAVFVAWFLALVM